MTGTGGAAAPGPDTAARPAPERHVFHGLRDLAGSVGIRLGPTGWRTVTQDDVTAFGRITGDEQWIHTDVERARRGPFGRTIAHGFLTLALCSWVLDELQTTTGVSYAINYGLDRVRFPATVPAGARVRGTVRLDTVTDRGGDVDAAWIVEITVEGAARPSCVATMLSRYRP
ncbi:MaoC family dehydratase [Streptosporangium sp. NPDC004631]